MAMSLRRILPYEVQALILCHFVKQTTRPACTALIRGSSTTRFSSTSALSSSDLFSPATPSAAEVRPGPASKAATQTSASVFEDSTSDYDQVPLSTLDHPPVPRTPDDLLISLLRANEHQQALDLLHDFQRSGQPIPPRYFFAAHAHRLALAAESGLADSAWLEWWKLAPPVVDQFTSSGRVLRREDARMMHAARRISRALICGVRSETVDFSRLTEFVAVLAQQGHARVVADEVLEFAAAYGPEGASEELFETTLAKLRRHQVAFQGADAASASALTRKAQRYLRSPRLTFAARVRIRRHLPRSNAASLQRWYRNRTTESYRALVLARAKSIRAHANLDRLDLAVQLVLETSQLPSIPVNSSSPATAIRLPSTLFDKLLALTATRSRFDLFEPLYAALTALGRRLVRVQDKALVTPSPYFIRAEHSPAAVAAAEAEAVPSVREAYTAYRFRHLVDAPVSTQAGGGLFEAEDDLAASSPGFGRAPHPLDLENLRRFTGAGPAGEEEVDFAASFRLVASFLSRRRLPPAHVIASWLAFARSFGEANPDVPVPQLLEQLGALASERGGAKPALRGYWTTATVLAKIKAGDHLEALRLWATHFDLAALPIALKAAYGEAVPTSKKDRWREKIEARAAAAATAQGASSRMTGKRFPPTAHAVSLFIEALVPQLELAAASAPESTPGSPADRARGRMNGVYRLLVDPTPTPKQAVRVVPSLHSTSFPPPKRFERPTNSHLSPHTFTPFLLSLRRLRAPPFALLSVLADISRLGLEPQATQYALVLGAFARLGNSNGSQSEVDSSASVDLRFLLDCFARGSSDSLYAPKASPAVVALIQSGQVALPSSPASLGVKTYTAILAGLRARGEKAVALDVLEGVVAERKEEVERWGREDERFRREVLALTQPKVGEA
ncbi:hypothetical protein JCM8097_008915 [Rhodosporidiobolus ruineniae]